jgi:two-component system response regulator PilR (NtrC family)
LVERAVALETSDRITTAWLPDPGAQSWSLGGKTAVASDALLLPDEQVQRAAQGLDRWLEHRQEPIDLEKLLELLERGVLEAALRHTRGNKTDAARLLGLTFRSLRYKLAKYGQDSDG